MKYFPENTTTRFTTQLQREISLKGQWVVGLSEIHIPCTMTHLQESETEIEWTPCDDETPVSKRIPHGLYKSHEEIVYHINHLPGLREAGIQIANARNANGYMAIDAIHKSECPPNVLPKNILRMSRKIQRILGFDKRLLPLPDWENSESIHLRFTRGIQRPASVPGCLNRALPDQLFVYTDICVPYTVGDTQTTLLRIVNLDTAKYTYGATQVKYFSPPNYIRLINNCFRSIEIDIRDHLGEPIAFEYGTLTLTLHFKRV